MTDCLICNEPMKEDGSRNYRRSTYWWWCEDCEFGQVDPMPSDDELEDYYSSQYRKDTHDHRDMGYEYDGSPGEWNYHEEEERAKGWLDYIVPPERHLDVGASTGKVLEVIDAPIQVGVEIGPWSELYTSYPRLEGLRNKFDLVTCLHTLEHVSDPIGFLSQIGRVSSGQVCIEVPQPVMRQWPHLLDFRKKSLLLAMDKAGLPAKIVEDAYHIKSLHHRKRPQPETHPSSPAGG